VGDAFARVYINSYANPHFHGECLKIITAKVDVEHTKLDQYKTEYAKQQADKLAEREASKAKTAEANKKLDFKKKIIKDALKSAIKVSKLSITHTTTGWGGIFKSGTVAVDRFKVAKPNKEYWNEPAILWVFMNGPEIVIQAGDGSIPTGPTTVVRYNFNLTDPDSIAKMGATMVGIGGRAWDPYLKKGKK
jgi:hypothetical protein